MEFKDIKGMANTELTKKLNETKKDLFNLKFKNSMGQLANPVQIRFLRKDIARMKTALNQKSKS